MTEWNEDQKWERAWWGNCCNTFGEEAKQISYAHRMRLVNEPRNGKWPVYDLNGRAIIDIGGGPTSMLLKTVNGSRLTVVDPCDYPSWVRLRYEAHGIDYVVSSGEDFVPMHGSRYDEAWIYNVLQHTRDPERIIINARRIAKLVRLFEWVDIPPHTGHPHELKADQLSKWLGSDGTVAQMNENGCIGRAFYGVFEP